MGKYNVKIVLVFLALAGVLACLLPWLEISLHTLPPGNLPSIVYYGYETIGKYTAICFLAIMMICLLTSFRKPITKQLAVMISLLATTALGIAAFDIIKIGMKSGMSGVVPHLEWGPIVIGLIAVSML
ncbi:hypothetical protein IAG15_14235, partial [Enterococcus faecalis]|nr:hypothetical protein [Enterococcus faecalis]